MLELYFKHMSKTTVVLIFIRIGFISIRLISYYRDFV